MQSKDDCKDGRIFNGLFLGPKENFCSTTTKYAIIDEHKTFRGFTNVSENLDRKEFFKMFDADNFFAKVPLSWKKGFAYDVIIPPKLRNCNICSKNVYCYICDKFVNQTKEFSADLNELQRKPPND